MTAPILPTWERVKDPDLVAWLRALPAEEQLKLADLKLDLLDRARGDAVMAEGIANNQQRIPFPPGFSLWSEAEKVVWWNEVYGPQMRELIAQDQAARQAAARGEVVD